MPPRGDDSTCDVAPGVARGVDALTAVVGQCPVKVVCMRAGKKMPNTEFESLTYRILQRITAIVVLSRLGGITLL